MCRISILSVFERNNAYNYFREALLQSLSAGSEASLLWASYLNSLYLEIIVLLTP